MNVNDEFEKYENDIEQYIDLFCKKYDIADMSKESQNRWNGCLQYIHNNLFDDSSFKYTPNINNEYDKNKLLELLDVYMYLCNTYTKEISIVGFCRLSGISKATIFSWKYESDALGMEIYKKIVRGNEQSNSDLLATSPRTLGIIAKLNYHHHWNMPNVTQEIKRPDSLESIAQRHGLHLEDKESTTDATSITLHDADF